MLRRVVFGTKILNGYSDAVKLIHSFRYGSFLITSIFYLISGSTSLLPFKATVIISLYVVSRILMDFYLSYTKEPSKLRIMILCETLAITFLLIPTGGLDSPFLWYALNPVLVAAWYMSSAFCWFNLFFYITAALSTSVGLFKKGQAMDLIYQHHYLLLVFILITILVQSLSSLLLRLQVANEKQRATMEQLMSLYQIVETFTAEDDWDSFFKTFTIYTAKLTKTPLAFFWQITEDAATAGLCTSVEVDSVLKATLANQIRRHFETLSEQSEIEVRLCGKNYYAMTVKSSTKLYGALGVQIENNEAADIRKHLAFLVDLTSIMLDRFAVEKANDRLMLLEERNRIANEIHDSVSQRLFGIVCSIHTLKRNWQNSKPTQVQQNLSLLSESATVAMRELRQSIYSLSTQKTGERIFFQSISLYLNSLAKLNGIEIDAKLLGDEEIIPIHLKKCLYRVICEATGNAIKHGRGNLVKVDLEISTYTTRLVVIDNGIGIDLSKITQGTSGLGLQNMKNLVHSLGGKFTLESGHGTKIEIKMPNLQSDYFCGKETLTK